MGYRAKVAVTEDADFDSSRESSMFLRLLAAFILIPFVELVLLLRMADATSWLTTLAIVVITGIIGSILARREGIAAWFRFQSALSQGRMPSREIQDGLMIAFAAALLLTPGLLTDAFGFALLTPWGRSLIGGWLRRSFSGRFEVRTFESQSSREPQSSHEPQPPREPQPSRFTEAPRPRRSTPGVGDTIDAPSFGPRRS